ncbi:MAG TPA: flavodoxin domain-containing protein [Gaiellaceae bacterium]|nr:flavodoxin domain-containing protein [Gaiellaceae bacterium]
MDGLLLVAYASNHGSTREVAEAIRGSLEKAGLRAELQPAEEVRELDGYDAIVLGAPIYMGRWHRHAHAFLRHHRDALAGRPLAVFALGPLHDDPKEWSEARAQLDTALARHDVQPRVVELFGGRVDPSHLHFPFSKMPAGDARDWAAITAWGDALPEALGLREQPAAV